MYNGVNNLYIYTIFYGLAGLYEIQTMTKIDTKFMIIAQPKYTILQEISGKIVNLDSNDNQDLMSIFVFHTFLIGEQNHHSVWFFLRAYSFNTCFTQTTTESLWV